MFKIAGWMIGSAAFVAALLALTRWLRRAEGQNVKHTHRLAAKLFSESLSERMKVEKDKLIDVLCGTVEGTHLETRIDQLVRQMCLTFRRLPSPGAVGVDAILTYRDGDTFSASTEIGWDSLPQSVREEFLRSGASQVTESWKPAWQASRK